MSSVVFIHGAYSTPLSFSYLCQDLRKQKNTVLVEYDSRERAEALLAKIRNTLVAIDGKIDIVGHSLGGVLAMVMCAYPEIKTKIEKMVTISSPLQGAEATKILKWMFPRENLFRTVHPTGPVISKLKDVALDHIQSIHIVTSGGMSPMMKEPNDGVVTVRSQLCSAIQGRFLRKEVNHFEVLLDPEVKKLLEDFLGG